ncbi:hypothetical protein N0B51_01755 [Tsuneonella sp. YG55]|uniref:Uncharacterized protein n=1 Tax=Tsuneonella litorea TaxID=2976475 RepID=A0A9X2VZ47_9SPHN|nr:hypothetical protein [Tsuneonella litorea]MCT2557698.1 hypothetical protein [Tsuneonella litorea]
MLFARSLPPVAAMLALAACGSAATDPGPGGVTVDEAAALDEAAAMLEERRLPASAIPSGALPSAAASATEESESAGEN